MSIIGKKKVNNFHQAGFTLFELIIVCVIIGVIFFAAWPSINAVTKKAGIEAAAEGIISMASYAREKALIERRRYCLEYRPDSKHISITTESDPYNSPGKFVEAGIKILRTSSIQLTMKPENKMYFEPDGRFDDVEFLIENSGGEKLTLTYKNSEGPIIVEPKKS